MPTPPVALVTGGARRIGRAICLRLGRAGFAVAVHHRLSAEAANQTVQELRAAGATAETFAADLSDTAQTLALAAAVEQRFGRVDLLVNNASEFRATPLLASSPERLARDADTFHAVHVRAPLLLVRALAPGMMSRRAGRIVNVIDVQVETGRAMYAPYLASKAALAALTKSLALELAPHVQVNAVSPGSILPPVGAAAASAERLTDGIPAGRLGTPDEVAEVVLFLATGPAYVTGEVLGIDGGR